MYEGFEQKPLVITSNSCDVWLAGFIFFKMMNLELIFTICDLEPCVNHVELELLIDIHEFTTLFSRILRP